MPLKRICTVIPIRVDDETSSYRIERLNHVLEDQSWRSFTDVLVVDDGSHPHFAECIKAQSEKNGFQYIYLPTRHAIFSVGRCRNQAAMHTQHRYIFFLDVDLFPANGFFEKLDQEIDVLKLDRNNNDFIMIPVSYLTEEATRQVKEIGVEAIAPSLWHATYLRDRSVCEKFSSGTSACLYDRFYFLTRGGNCQEFGGWGYEDIEFNCRMARLSHRFPEPDNWSRDRGSFDAQYEYQGFKSMYRLFGDRSLFKGLMLFHAWHPVNLVSDYGAKRHDNRGLFQQKIREFELNSIEPDPLPDYSQNIRTVRFRDNTFVKNRQLEPHLGHVITVDENSFKTVEEFNTYLSANSITQVLFHNPYANDQMRTLYDWCRATQFPRLIAERGALPNSIFYDPDGFLADSKQYDEALWNRPLSDEELASTVSFIRELTDNARHLEKQGDRQTEAVLRRRLNLAPSDKLILVCLQRPGDTATRYFDGPAGGYADFIEAVSCLAYQLPKNYRLVYKRHPLEDSVPSIAGTDVSDIHLDDLLILTDKLIVFNSGVGLLAAMRNIPTVLYGRAFYACPGINFTVKDAADLQILASSELYTDNDKILRFFRYLKDEYYSFGKMTTRDVVMDTGERMTATTDIFFEQLVIRDRKIRIDCPNEPRDDWKSMGLDRYQFHRHSRKSAVYPQGAGRAVGTGMRPEKQRGVVLSILRAGYFISQKIPGGRLVSEPILQFYLSRRKLN